MTRGAWMCSRQYDDGLKIWFAPRENEKPFTDSERAQKWRLSLASLLFFTVLLSDHLWFCAEAKFTGTGEKEQQQDFYLSFCNSYTLWELFAGLSNPDTLNCSLDVVLKGEGSCSQCVQAYQRYDQHAQEKYEEFEVMLQKYLQSDEYSVKSCPEDCKTVYKAWLCSQYFEVTQFHCSNRIPCKQYCLEVQTRCPFILPDNDDVIYGGLSSFICTGLYENYPTNAEPECCDVRWGLLSDHQSKGTIKTSGSTMCHRTSLTVSSASRLCNSRLKLCVLVLILLHTVLTVSAAQNSTGLGFGGITTLEDNSTSEE
nr:PREDICTED: transmembrane protein FAM155A [Struthio camelus australis]